MSGYYPPNQGQQYPPQGHSPYPPQQSPYPPQQGHSPYPPQQAPYGQPPMQHQQPPYGQAPPQGYGAAPQAPYGQQPPPGQQQYGAPPAGYPPQAPYGQQPGYPPQQQPGYPPQQQPGYPPQPYGAPAHGAHPGQAPYGQQPGYPPQGGYMAPAPSGPPTPASPGYLPGVLPPSDMNAPATQLRDAMKGFGTNEKLLIQVLTQVPDPQHMEKLRRTYDDRFRRQLLKDIEKETSGWFEAGLLALARGPLLQDAYCVEKAIRGLGTKESMLDDVCLGRSNADMNAIKACYMQIYGKPMEKEIKDDLSMKTERLYEYVLSARRAEESTPCLPHEIDQQTDKFQQATEGTKLGTNQDIVCQILAYSSDGQIRAINQRYQEKYRKTLDDVIKSEFSGHMKEALRLMVRRAVDRVKTDAEDLEASMKGMGTKDELLVTRLVRAHWNREHMRQVNVAYKRFYNKSLVDRVKGETSGDYKALMMALC